MSKKCTIARHLYTQILPILLLIFKCFWGFFLIIVQIIFRNGFNHCVQSGPLCAHYGGGKSIVLQSLVAAEQIVFGKLCPFTKFVYLDLLRKKAIIETKTSAETLSFLFCSIFKTFVKGLSHEIRVSFF